MQAVLLRVGIDSGSGGMHGPLFRDGSFEFVPIPESRPELAPGETRTYGRAIGRSGRPLIDFFPAAKRPAARDRVMHVDPEFATYTYGDPSRTKAGLRRLENGDLLLFYAGLEGSDAPSMPALYLIGYFDVERVARASELGNKELSQVFGANFHVRYLPILEAQRSRLLLVKGSDRSRLLSRAVCISERGRDKDGRPLKVLSSEMREVFGPLPGRGSLQRSNPRWIEQAYVEGVREFVCGLP